MQMRCSLVVAEMYLSVDEMWPSCGRSVAYEDEMYPSVDEM